MSPWGCLLNPHTRWPLNQWHSQTAELVCVGTRVWSCRDDKRRFSWCSGHLQTRVASESGQSCDLLPDMLSQSVVAAGVRCNMGTWELALSLGKRPSAGPKSPWGLRKGLFDISLSYPFQYWKIYQGVFTSLVLNVAVEWREPSGISLVLLGPIQHAVSVSLFLFYCRASRSSLPKNN